MQAVPWTVVQQTPGGRKSLKDGAHGEVSVTSDGESVYKAVPRNVLGEIPYEFIMEMISRERCADIDPEISRIMPIQAVIESPQHYVLQMRNIKGGDVWDLISEDKLQKMDIRGIARDVVQAVRVLHARGVAHRDIKDANVLVEENSTEPGKHRAFLCDMSLATCSPHIVGDPFLPYTGRYRPPEVISYGTRFDFVVDWYKADIYALGAFIARMVSSALWGSGIGGHPPNRREVERKMPNFPGKSVVLAMMRNTPSERPTAAEALSALGLEGPPPSELPAFASPVIVSAVPEIVAFAKSKEFPPWVAEVACEVFAALPSEERVASSHRFCVAMAAKIGVMVRERDVLGRRFISDHKGDMKRLSGVVVRNAASRRAIHRLLRSSLPHCV
jgi:serine/threonine protein kinase